VGRLVAELTQKQTAGAVETGDMATIEGKMIKTIQLLLTYLLKERKTEQYR
jgi:hypothetical protein